MNHWSERPSADEYNAFYSGYVGSVPDGDVLEFLTQQRVRMQQMIEGLDDAQKDYQYAPDKWTVRELIGHMVDTEWIFASRLLRIARNDPAALPGMDQDDFMANADFANRSTSSLLTEFSGLRTASLALMDSLPPPVLDRKGNASGFEITVRALGWILAGHCEHHLTIMRDRYEVHVP